MKRTVQALGSGLSVNLHHLIILAVTLAVTLSESLTLFELQFYYLENGIITTLAGLLREHSCKALSIGLPWWRGG